MTEHATQATAVLNDGGAGVTYDFSDAVVLVTRLEAITQLHHQRTGSEMIRKTCRVELGVTGRDVALGEPQKPGLLALGLAPP